MTDPDDETQPHAIPGAIPPAAAPPSTTTSGPGSLPAASQPAGSGAPPLRAAPPPAEPSTWREPPWAPPRPRERRPSAAAIVIGVVILAIGLYYFVDRTLGIHLPPIQVGSLWPLILIVIGGAIVLRALSRDS